MRICVCDHRERHARFLPSAQRLNPPPGHLYPSSSLKQPLTLRHAESRQLRPDFLLVVLRVQILHQLVGRFIEVQLVHVMLREHAAPQLVVPNHLPFQRDQIAQQKLAFSSRGETPTLTIVDLPIPLGPKIPIRESKSIPKFTFRKRIRSGVYLPVTVSTFPHPKVTSLDCKMGICRGSGYSMMEFDRTHVHKLKAKHGILRRHRNRVHFLLQFLHDLQFALHLPIVQLFFSFFLRSSVRIHAEAINKHHQMVDLTLQ